MRADIFVHPDYFSLRAEADAYLVESYEDELQRIMSQSELPILVHEPQGVPVLRRNPDSKKVEEGEFWKEFDEISKFRTQSRRGLLGSRYEAMDLIALMQSSDVEQVVIHGSYLNACVKQFSRGLRMATCFGNLAYLVSEVPRQLVPIDKSALDIRLGTVLSLGMKRSDEDIRRRGELPGNLRDFACDETSISYIDLTVLGALS
jgi:hypothetical protein